MAISARWSKACRDRTPHSQSEFAASTLFASLEAGGKGRHPLQAEGVSTAREVARLAVEQGIEMPITEAVDAILHRGLPAAEAVETLLSRDPKPEMQ